MATKKFIIEVEEGITDCKKCPKGIMCEDLIGSNCIKYDLATMKIKQPVSHEELRKFANQYSYNIWEQLMQRFKVDDKFYIGANDVSDYILNAILDTYKKMMESEQCSET